MAGWLKGQQDKVPKARRADKIWNVDGTQHHATWHRALAGLRMPASADGPGFTPAGLRGGGASEHYLVHRDVQGLRRRGRWTQVTTLDRYLQEGVLLLAQHGLSETTKRMAALAVNVFRRPLLALPEPAERPLLALAPAERPLLACAACSGNNKTHGGVSGQCVSRPTTTPIVLRKGEGRRRAGDRCHLPLNAPPAPGAGLGPTPPLSDRVRGPPTASRGGEKGAHRMPR